MSARTHNINFNFLKTWSADLAYILAFTVCDGCLGHIGNRKFIQYELSIKDLKLLEFIRDKISPLQKIYFKTRNLNGKNYEMCHLKITSIELFDIFLKYNIFQRKTNKEKMPNDLPEEYKMDYLRGIIDGDGCLNVYKNNGYKHIKLIITSGGKEFLEEINNKLLNNYGKIYKSRNNYQLYVYKQKQVKEICSKIYNGNYCLDRKYKKYKEVIDV